MKKSMGGKSVNRINTHKQKRKQNLKYKYNSKKRQYGGQNDQNVYNSVDTRKQGGKSKNKNNTKKLRSGGVNFGIANTAYRVANRAYKLGDSTYAHEDDLRLIHEAIIKDFEGIDKMMSTRKGFGYTITGRTINASESDKIFIKYNKEFENRFKYFEKYLKVEEENRTKYNEKRKPNLEHKSSLNLYSSTNIFDKQIQIDKYSITTNKNYMYYMKNYDIDKTDLPHINYDIEKVDDIAIAISRTRNDNTITIHNVLELIKIYKGILNKLYGELSDISKKEINPNYKDTINFGGLYANLFTQYSLSNGNINLGKIIKSDNNNKVIEFEKCKVKIADPNNCIYMSILKIPYYENNNCYYCSVDNIYTIYKSIELKSNPIKTETSKEYPNGMEYFKELSDDYIFFINDRNFENVTFDPPVNQAVFEQCNNGDLYSASKLGKLIKITETYYTDEIKLLQKNDILQKVNYRLTFEFTYQELKKGINTTKNTKISFPLKPSTDQTKNKYEMIFFVVSQQEITNLESQKINNTLLSDNQLLYKLYQKTIFEYSYGMYNNIRDYTQLVKQINNSNLQMTNIIDEQKQKLMDNLDKEKQNLKEIVRRQELLLEYSNAIRNSDVKQKKKLLIDFKEIREAAKNDENYDLTKLDKPTEEIIKIVEESENNKLNQNTKIFTNKEMEGLIKNRVFNNRTILKEAGNLDINISADLYKADKFTGINGVATTEKRIKEDLYNIFGNNDKKYIRIHDVPEPKYYDLYNVNTPGVIFSELIDDYQNYSDITLYLSQSVDSIVPGQIYFLFNIKTGAEIVFYRIKGKEWYQADNKHEFHVLSPTSNTTISWGGDYNHLTIDGNTLTIDKKNILLYSITRNIYYDLMKADKMTKDETKNITLQIDLDNIVEDIKSHYRINEDALYFMSNEYYSIFKPYSQPKYSINSFNILVPISEITTIKKRVITQNEIYIIANSDKSIIIPFYQNSKNEYIILKEDIMYNETNIVIKEKMLKMINKTTFVIDITGYSISFDIEDNATLYSLPSKQDLLDIIESKLLENKDKLNHIENIKSYINLKSNIYITETKKNTEETNKKNFDDAMTNYKKEYNDFINRISSLGISSSEEPIGSSDKPMGPIFTNIWNNNNEINILIYDENNLEKNLSKINAGIDDIKDAQKKLLSTIGEDEDKRKYFEIIKKEKSKFEDVLNKQNSIIEDVNKILDFINKKYNEDTSKKIDTREITSKKDELEEFKTNMLAHHQSTEKFIGSQNYYMASLYDEDFNLTFKDGMSNFVNVYTGLPNDYKPSDYKQPNFYKHKIPFVKNAVNSILYAFGAKKQNDSKNNTATNTPVVSVSSASANNKSSVTTTPHSSTKSEKSLTESQKLLTETATGSNEEPDESDL
jgi:hypothetical protein